MSMLTPIPDPVGSAQRSSASLAGPPMANRSFTNIAPWETKQSSPIVTSSQMKACVLDPAPPADDHAALDLDEWARQNHRPRWCSRIGLRRFGHGNVVTKGDIDDADSSRMVGSIEES